MSDQIQWKSPDKFANEEFFYRLSPSEWTETAVRIPLEGRAQPFSFEGREYLRKVYDTPSKRILMKCGRQTEKCVQIDSLISSFNGALIKAREVTSGSRVPCLSKDRSHVDYGLIEATSKIRIRPCVRITTRQGHKIEVGVEHPMRTWDDWVLAGQLQVKDRIAVVREVGRFTGISTPSKERICLTAFMIGDGSCHKSQLNFTSLPGLVMSEFGTLLENIGDKSTTYPKKGTRACSIKIRNGQLHDWLEEDRLIGTKSATKFIPPWVFDLSRDDTALFLNRLWSTDGSIKKPTRSIYNLVYCSISEQLILEVQALLWKFGIPSRVRKNWPNYWKKRGKKKFAYILRIETQEGVRRFLSEIGALGKTEEVESPDYLSNNNQDTYPIEINELILSIIDSHSGPLNERLGRNSRRSLSSEGLRNTLKYPPTKEKIEQYVFFFRSDERYDQKLVDELEVHIDTDLYWDSIKKIEKIGEQECIDFQVDSGHSFVANGFITHNSTMLANRLLAYCCLNSHFTALYVSSAQDQAKVFSQDRIAEVIHNSPSIAAYTNSKLTQNLFHKRFINRSDIRLRYAYLSADRVRGIPADLISIDEIQDVLIDNIPVIEQCASHSSYKLFCYSGTPKSLDNTIEQYWIQFSTQNEWIVPCERHGTPNNKGTWHWNILTEENIGKNGLICDKCFNPISAMHPSAQWASMQPAKGREDIVSFEGFHITQLMVPWLDWEEIRQNQERYSRQKFNNEVLGQSYDSGIRPLTRAQLKACCKDHLRFQDIEQLRSMVQGAEVFAGIDWGSGENSYTVLTLGAYLGGNFSIFFAHRFTGRELEPPLQMDIISQIISQFNVTIVGVDYGGGFDRNDMLIRRFGPQKIQKYQYTARLKRKVIWDEGVRRWKVHRTEIMSDVFNAIKRKQIDLPNWNDFEDPYAQDCLNIFSEYNERLRMIQYQHSPNATDDTLHSILYCLLASMIRRPRPDLIAPRKEGAG